MCIDVVGIEEQVISIDHREIGADVLGIQFIKKVDFTFCRYVSSV